MSETLIIALLNFATRFGTEAAVAFMKNRGATIDDAISALEKASEKSLDQYKLEAKQ